MQEVRKEVQSGRPLLWLWSLADRIKSHWCDYRNNCARCHCEQNYFGILTKKIYKLHMTNYHENIQDNEENNSKKPNEKKSSHEEKSKKEWWCHFCKKYFFGVLYSVFYDMHMSNFHGGAKTKSTKSPPPDFDFGQKKSKNRDPPKSPPKSTKHQQLYIITIFWLGKTGSKRFYQRT